MASILKENQVRVNTTCISISKWLFNQFGFSNPNDVKADVNFTKSGGLRISFKPGGKYDVSHMGSLNQVVINIGYVEYEIRCGLYECTIFKNEIRSINKLSEPNVRYFNGN